MSTVMLMSCINFISYVAQVSSKDVCILTNVNLVPLLLQGLRQRLCRYWRRSIKLTTKSSLHLLYQFTCLGQLCGLCALRWPYVLQQKLMLTQTICTSLWNLGSLHQFPYLQHLVCWIHNRLCTIDLYLYANGRSISRRVCWRSSIDSWRWDYCRHDTRRESQ